MIFEQFLESLTNADKDCRIVIKWSGMWTKFKIPHSISIQSGSSNQSSLKYLLLNPSIHFSSIVQDTRAIIVAGGTMEPVSICPLVHPTIYPSIHSNMSSTKVHPSIHSSVYLSILQFIHPFIQHVSISSSYYLSIHPFKHVIYKSASIYSFICLFVHPTIHPSIYPTCVHPFSSIYSFIYPFIQMSEFKDQLFTIAGVPPSKFVEFSCG